MFNVEHSDLIGHRGLSTDKIAHKSQGNNMVGEIVWLLPLNNGLALLRTGLTLFESKRVKLEYPKIYGRVKYTN